jgi:tetratricopeptide (TPR) repeat protein
MYKRAIEADPNRTPSLCNYAYLLKCLKRDREALTYFNRAATLNPEHPWVLKNRSIFSPK